MYYDHCIIGCGPCGLTLASLLPGNNILIEKDKNIGGCHRVSLQEGLFSEHGPRIYGTTYINSQDVLAQMGITWDEHFVPYDFQFLSIGLDTVSTSLSLSEMSKLTLEFLKFCFIDPPVISIGEWMTANNFSLQAQDTIDRICRMTDGADKTRYLLSSFLELFNQNFFYHFQQPNAPMSVLFERWGKRIESKNGCPIYTGEEVIEIAPNTVYTDKRIISAKKIIFAMPPQYIAEIIKQSNYNPFSDGFLVYAEKTKYLKYYCLTFHFSKEYQFEKIYGLTKDSKWGIVFIKLDDYMKEVFIGNMFSIAVTIIDQKGYNGKMAIECSNQEIKNEVFDQMNRLFHFPEKPKIILYNKDDQAWVLTKEGYGECQGKDDFYAVSCHLGKSPYAFTSFESAVCNAIWFVNMLTGSSIPIKKIWTVDYVVKICLVILLLVVFWMYLKNA
jgi:hypothetical protein